MDVLFVSEKSNDFFNDFQKSFFGFSTMLGSPDDSIRKFLTYQPRAVVFLDKQTNSDNNPILKAYSEIKSLTKECATLIYIGDKKDGVDCIDFARASKIRNVLNFHLSRLNQPC